MKKRDKKLSLSRETMLQLDATRLPVQELLRVKGAAAEAIAIQTSCIGPNCCGDGTQ